MLCAVGRGGGPAFLWLRMGLRKMSSAVAAGILSASLALPGPGSGTGVGYPVQPRDCNCILKRCPDGQADAIFARSTTFPGQAIASVRRQAGTRTRTPQTTGLPGLRGPDVEFAVVGRQNIYGYYESAHRGATNSF